VKIKRSLGDKNKVRAKATLLVLLAWLVEFGVNRFGFFCFFADGVKAQFAIKKGFDKKDG